MLFRSASNGLTEQADPAASQPALVPFSTFLLWVKVGSLALQPTQESLQCFFFFPTHAQPGTPELPAADPLPAASLGHTWRTSLLCRKLSKCTNFGNNYLTMAWVWLQYGLSMALGCQHVVVPV